MGVIGSTSAMPATQPISNAASDAESLFRQFTAGTRITSAEILDLLREAQFGVETVESISYGYFRKIVARVRMTNGDMRFAKIAVHPYPVRLLEREAEGIRAARAAPLWGVTVPVYDLRKISAERAVALLEPLPGSALSPAATLRTPAGPFRYTGATERIDVYLERLFQTMPSCDEARAARQVIDRLVRKAEVETIPVAPAHGDFVYWNLLRCGDGRVSVMDFEDFRPAAIAGYDRFYWSILPLTRFSVRHGLHAVQAGTIKPIARKLWSGYARRAPVRFPFDDGKSRGLGCMALAITLAEHMAQMLKEHELTDIRALIGDDAMALRCALIAQYRCLMERLAR